MLSHSTNIEGYVKNLIQVGNNYGNIYINGVLDEEFKESSVKDYLVSYYAKLLEEIGLFAGPKLSAPGTDVDIYIEPGLWTGQHQLSIKEVIDKYRRVLITGDVAVGKTTVLTQIVISCIKEELPYIPVYIGLKDYTFLGTGLEALIQSKLQSSEFGSGSKIFERLAKEDRVLILLDGMDEVFRKADLTKLGIELRSLCINNPLLRVVITSRNEDRLEFPKGFDHFLLKGFGADQVASFIEKWHVARNGSAPEDIIKAFNDHFLLYLDFDFGTDRQFISKRNTMYMQRHGLFFSINVAQKSDNPIITNPMTLGHLCLYFEKHGKMPDTLTELHSMMDDLVWEQWNHERLAAIELRLGRSFPIPELRWFCQYLAWEMLASDQITLSADKAYQLARNYFSERGFTGIDYMKLLELLSLDFGILKVNEGRLYSFIHRVTQEFYAGAYLAEKPADTASLFDLYFTKRKKEVVAHYFNLSTAAKQEELLHNFYAHALSSVDWTKPGIKHLLQSLKEKYGIEPPWIAGYSSPTPEEAKERLFLFYYYFSLLLATETVNNLVELTLTVCEQLLWNLYDYNVLTEDANYLLINLLFRLQKLAKDAGLSKAVEDGAFLRTNFPDGKIYAGKHTTLLDKEESKEVCTFLYIMERTLSIANKKRVNVVPVLSAMVPVPELKQKDRIDLAQLDFFQPYDLMSYFKSREANEERLSLVPEILKRAYRSPGVYVVLAKDLQDMKQYSLAVEVLDYGIKDLSENPFYIKVKKKCLVCGEVHENFDPFHESSQVIDYELSRTPEGLREWLYLVKGHVLVYWSNHENFVSPEKLELAIASYEQFPEKDMSLNHRTYFAFALAKTGTGQNNEAYMNKAYQLYKKCVKENPAYFEGLQWLVELSHRLKKSAACKKHLKDISSFVSKEDYETYFRKYESLDA